jgi:nuclear pore complex protein Nup88
MLEAKLKGEEGRKSGLVGPLRMYPEAEDNYGGDACSLLVLDTKPPVVAMATSNGTVYHSLLMSNHSIGQDQSAKDPGKALFVVESVQLEIGFSLGSLEDDDDFISCPVRLEPDPIEKSRLVGIIICTLY